ncbi:MAG TPA: substrate-binding domain-containing protein, partial [Pseudonocardiaceae bacterium]|nr:substrate-binding domain-containing protein [Pseudonocardiaceae bacterium]
TQHLIDLGHTRIAHLSGPTDTYSARRRREGCEQALVDAGLPLLASAESAYTINTGRDAMHQLLDSPTPPTGVVVANIASAAGGLMAARERGIAIPDKLSVIDLHDLELAASLGPPLTTVRMPLEELGRGAVRLLLGTPWDQPIDAVIPGPMDIVERGSTDRPPPSSPSGG